MGYLWKLRRAGVPVRYGRVVTLAQGDDRVESVTHAPVDASWNPDSSRSERERVDTLCIG